MKNSLFIGLALFVAASANAQTEDSQRIGEVDLQVEYVSESNSGGVLEFSYTAASATNTGMATQYWLMGLDKDTLFWPQGEGDMRLFRTRAKSERWTVTKDSDFPIVLFLVKPDQELLSEIRDAAERETHMAEPDLVSKIELSRVSNFCEVSTSGGVSVNCEMQ